MNSKELHKTLAQYIGLRVRISSDATSSNTLWRDSYPELVEVITREQMMRCVVRQAMVSGLS